MSGKGKEKVKKQLEKTPVEPKKSLTPGDLLLPPRAKKPQSKLKENIEELKRLSLTPKTEVQKAEVFEEGSQKEETAPERDSPKFDHIFAREKLKARWKEFIDAKSSKKTSAALPWTPKENTAPSPYRELEAWVQEQQKLNAEEGDFVGELPPRELVVSLTTSPANLHKFTGSVPKYEQKTNKAGKLSSKR